MAILIKDMEMPESCFLCRFCRRQEYGEYIGEDTAWSCVASKKRITDGRDLIATFKHPDCPLVEAAEVPDAVCRQAAIDAAKDWYDGLICGSFRGLEKRLKSLPSAQPERPKGKWVKIPEFCGDDVSGFIDNHFSCSECKKEAEINPWGFYILSDFCPHCGADMRGE